MWLLVIYAVFDGIARGGAFSVISPMVAEMFGTRSHGLLYGAVAFAGTLGGAAGPIIAGHTFDRFASYEYAIVTLAVVATAGLFATLLMKSPVGQQIRKAD